METSNSGANHAVLHAQNERWGLGPIETINSGHNDAVVNAQNHSNIMTKINSLYGSQTLPVVLGHAKQRD